MISVSSSGSFAKLTSFLNKPKNDAHIMSILNEYGYRGVLELARATNVHSGRTARSWYFKVARRGSVYTITWYNSDVENGFPVAIMLQYGYATGTGGYVQGYDYINPAMRPIFDGIATEVWKVVTAA